jgi:hypothetical protein
MKFMDARILSTGILFILTVVSGVWLSRMDRPLNTAILTIHKLIALATIVLMVIAIKGMSKGMPVNGAIITAIAVTAVLFLALFATGAILSSDKPVNQLIKGIHAVLPVLAAISAFISIYLLTGKA